MKRRKLHRVEDSLLLENLEYRGSYSVDTTVELISFDRDTLRHKRINSAAGLTAAIDPQKVNWVHVRGLSNTALISDLCTVFDIQRLSVQDILNADHIAKIEESNGHLLVIIDVFDYNENNVLMREHLSIVLGKNFVISFQESADNRFKMIADALSDKLGHVRCRQADYLFNLLMSTVVDRYLEELEIQQNMMLDLEDLLMEFRTNIEGAGRKIQDYRKDYLTLKKSIFPIREQFAHLLVLDSPLIAESTHIYFKDTYDHLQQAYMMVESCRETIVSLLDLYLANNDLRMNHIMKQLTVVSTVFIPLTFLVGVWGMNFHFMPELDWTYGYLAAWLVMLGIGVLIYFYFKRKKWY
ncbi:MAG: magnesium/cobalt transporter CorA [Prevotellaceae bacterium]|jgi:magnesium transporter|nr:magnesium/cobalt transporter CorA [Prevotellaceae bacterium]